MAESVAPSSPDDDVPELDAKHVREWLLAHPEFLQQHPELLEQVDLQHASGHASSLIERQVEWLRAKNARLEARMSPVSYTHLTLPTICSV